MLDLSHAEWRKSSRSVGGNCVEVAFLSGRVVVRDSTDQQGPVLLFTNAAWHSFVRSVRDGEFDLP
jgi:Domain of unknown function (DUF397)